MFIPNLELNTLFYSEVVGPILARRFPGLRYSAALIGSGSDVLGYDTQQSTDHDWVPRLCVFLSNEDYLRHADTVVEDLRHTLPVAFRGYLTNYATASDGVRVLQKLDEGPVNHLISVDTLDGIMQKFLGLNANEPISPIKWLTTPSQILLSLTAGRVYHDGLGTLKPLRQQLAYYPHDVWLYLLAGGLATHCPSRSLCRTYRADER